MANRVPTLLATAVAAACSLSAHANGPTPADFAKVVLYADVTIAQDSASQWGIWEQLEPTAAGPQTPLPLLPSGGEVYRPLGTVSLPQPQPQPGVLMGFGVISNADFGYGEELRAEAFSPFFFESMRAGIKLTTSEVSEAKIQADSWQPVSLNITTELVRNDLTDTPTTYANLGPLEHDGDITHRRLAETEEGVERINLVTVPDRVPAETQAGQFFGDISIGRYVSGEGKPYYTERQSEMYGVWGLTTSAQDMNNLRQSNASANYAGAVLNQQGEYNGSVSMQVNFGRSEFSASFTDVGGGQVATGNNMGITISERLSFNASGSVNGSQFSANQLSPGVTGQVVGAFFGPQAAAAGGVIDVVAVPNQGAQTSPRTLTRYAAPFIAVKGEPRVELSIDK